MHYRDFMQKYRPVYSPDEPAAASAATGGEVAAAAVGDGQAAPAASAGPSAEPAAAAPVADASPAAAEAPKGEPSLLEAASGTKPEAAAADAPAADKDSPAPAEAAAESKDVKPDGEKPPADAKDKKPDGEAPKDDKAAAETDPAKKEATAAEPPAPIKYEAFKVPEGLKLDDDRIGKFTEVAGAGQVSQDVAQSLLDLHVAEMQRFSQDVVKQAEQHQRDVWRKLNDTWKTEMRNDPEIGGNRMETSLSRAKAVIEEYLGPENGGSPEMVRDMIAHTTANGMGNFPPFVRLMNKIGEVLNIFEDSPVTANPTSPKPAKGPGQRGWYPSMGSGQPPQS